MEGTVAIGADTHRHVHVAVALDRLGAQLDSREIETTRALLPPCFPGRWSSAPRLRARGCRRLRGRARPLLDPRWRRRLRV
jgi:hypothetical protein